MVGVVGITAAAAIFVVAVPIVRTVVVVVAVERAGTVTVGGARVSRGSRSGFMGAFAAAVAVAAAITVAVAVTADIARAVRVASAIGITIGGVLVFGDSEKNGALLID